MQTLRAAKGQVAFAGADADTPLRAGYSPAGQRTATLR